MDFLFRRHLTAVSMALLVCTWPASVATVQDSQPTFRSRVAVVPIAAVVRDAQNRVVRELKKEDFQVFEDGHPRRVVEFNATERGPLTLGVLFDTSGSMRGRNLHNGKAILSALIDQLDRASDEAALFTFDKATRQETPFTNDSERLREALDATEAWGLTSLWDAIGNTAEQVGERRSQRRAVIVITDGFDTSSVMRSPDVSALASAVDVPVYLLAVERAQRHETSDDIPGEDPLINLARWTGGDVRHVSGHEDAKIEVALMLAELRQQYFLAIESQADGGWYRIDVRTRRKGLTVRARSAYFAAPTTRP